MAGPDDSDEVRALRQRLAEYETRLAAEVQRARAATVMELENATQEAVFVLEQEIARLSSVVDTLERDNDRLRGLLHSECFARDGEMCVRPYWRALRLRTHCNVGFLVMPFRPSWAQAVEESVGKALRAHGMRCQRADRLSGPSVMSDMWQSVCRSGVVVADLTETNPNVMYELGLADAIGQKVVLISQTAQVQEVPFDLLGRRLIVYSASSQNELDALRDRVDQRLGDLLASDTREAGD